jgi:PIN domain nuclease of toxin-antitoxin system
MIENILDASAVLAVLQNERGMERVTPILDGSAIGQVNATEVLTTLVNKGAPISEAILALASLDLPVVEFDKSQSEMTSHLRFITKHLGLSLGDRACLALAIQENATAVTADRNWIGLSVCPIEAIR